MSLLTFVLFYVLVLVQAVPLAKRIVVSPHITSPTASTTWNVGDKVTATWDTSSIPQPGNFTGQLLLGFLAGNSENLDVDHPLAQGFLLSTGSVQITVPNVPDRTNYIVVLFGDSGNASPQFTITGGSSTTTTLSPSPSPTSTSTSTPPFPPPNTPLSPAPVSSAPSSPSPSPVSPTSTLTPASTTATSPSVPVSSPTSNTSSSQSVTATTNTPTTNAPSNPVSTSSTGTSNSALPALRARGAGAISLCVAAAAMSLVFVL